MSEIETVLFKVLEQMRFPQRSILFTKQRKWRYLEIKLRLSRKLACRESTQNTKFNYSCDYYRIETVLMLFLIRQTFQNIQQEIQYALELRFFRSRDKVIELISPLIARHVPKKKVPLTCRALLFRAEESDPIRPPRVR